MMATAIWKILSVSAVCTCLRTSRWNGKISSVEEWEGWNVKPRATLPSSPPLAAGPAIRRGTVAAGRQRSALPLSLPSVEVVFPGENANDVVCVEFLLPHTRDDNHQHPKCGCWYVSAWHTHVFAPGGPGKTTTTTTNGCQYEMDDTTGTREHRSNNDISSTHAIQMMAWRRAGVAACVDT